MIFKINPVLIALTIGFSLFFSSCKKSGNGCSTPSGLASKNITYNSATLEWKPQNGAISYTVNYRPVGSSQWNTNVVKTDTFLATSLNIGTIYEWQVQTICDSGLSAFTGSNVFTTDTAPGSSYIKVSYQGQTHIFICPNGLQGDSLKNFTETVGYEAITNNGIDLFQEGLSNGTNNFDEKTFLNLNIGSSNYSSYTSGTATRTINNGSASIIFNCTIYNMNNFSDSIILTNGSYIGTYTP